MVNRKMAQNQTARNLTPNAGDFLNNSAIEGEIKEVKLHKRGATVVLQSGQVIKLGEKEVEYLNNLFDNGGQLFVWKEAEIMNGEYISNSYLTYYWIIVRRLQQKGLIRMYKVKMGRGAPSTKAELTALGYGVVKMIIKQGD